MILDRKRRQMLQSLNTTTRMHCVNHKAQRNKGKGLLSKIDHGDQEYTPLSMMLQKCLQRVRYAAASFATGHYVNSTKAILKLGWLPIEQRGDLSLLKQIFKALNSDTSHDYLQLNVRSNKR